MGCSLGKAASSFGSIRVKKFRWKMLNDMGGIGNGGSRKGNAKSKKVKSCGSGRKLKILIWL